MVYMRGFRIGASGSTWLPRDMEHADFKQGHEDGRKAAQDACAEATTRYVVSPSLERQGLAVSV